MHICSVPAFPGYRFCTKASRPALPVPELPDLWTMPAELTPAWFRQSPMSPATGQDSSSATPLVAVVPLSCTNRGSVFEAEIMALPFTSRYAWGDCLLMPTKPV